MKIYLSLIVALSCVVPAVVSFAVQQEVCFDCHEKAQFTDKVIHKPVRTGKCITCHNPHVAKYPGLLRYEGGKLCFSCHTKEAKSMKKGIVHEPINRNQCTVCHTPHAAPEKGLVRKELKLDCLRCHNSLKEKYNYTHEPYRNGECSACHEPHNSQWPLLLVTSKEKLCFQCHDEGDLQAKHKGYPEPLGECLTCHNPHGGIRPALIRNYLHEPYKDQKGCSVCHEKSSGKVGVDKCIRCHSDVIKQMETTHSHLTEKDGNSCVNCHSPHAGDEKRLLKMREKQVCAQCHRPPIDWYKNSPYRHQSIDECTDCHYPHGGNDMAMLKGNGLEVCAQCHEDQGSFTHPVGPDVPDPRTGRMLTCITCHNPMGTNYPNNLIQDGKEKLCVQCHPEY